jgi:hypothetical protein
MVKKRRRECSEGQVTQMRAVAAAKLTDARLTDELARRVMGWRVAPGRFIKSGRGWIPRWRFDPLSRFDDAFLLLHHAAASYRLVKAQRGLFTAVVQVSGRTGTASGAPKARTITVAIARSLGIEV